MPSIAHEVPIELFRERPELVPQLLADLFGVELPPHREARIEESSFTEMVLDPWPEGSPFITSLPSLPGPLA